MKSLRYTVNMGYIMDKYRIPWNSLDFREFSSINSKRSNNAI